MLVAKVLLFFFFFWAPKKSKINRVYLAELGTVVEVSTQACESRASSRDFQSSPKSNFIAGKGHDGFVTDVKPRKRDHGFCKIS